MLGTIASPMHWPHIGLPARRTMVERREPTSPSPATDERHSATYSPVVAALEERLRVELAPGLLVVREIGAGGMARVFLAREPALKRLVAIKVLSPAMLGDTAT